MLVVEDDTIIYNTLKRVFQEDYVIDFCESAEIFYDKFAGIQYDIILMDISLKGKFNGLDLTKKLKSDPIHRDTPILCLTAHAGPQDKHNAREAGVDGFLVKPVENSVLRLTVNKLVRIN